MTYSNETRDSQDGPAQRRGTGLSTTRIAGAADQATSKTGGGAHADAHPVRDARRGGTAFRDNPRRIGRAREGAAPVDDAGDRLSRGARVGRARAASDRSATGERERDRLRISTPEGGAPAEGGVADHEAEGADTGRADSAPAGGADSGEAQQELEPEEPRTGAGGMFRSLKVYNYRLFFIGGTVSNLGGWMQRTAQDLLVLDLAKGSGMALGITTALQFLPMLLFGLFGGVLADRYPKRPVLITAQVLMGVLALAMGLLTVTGSAQVWHVWVMAFALGVISCVEVPARQSFVVEMVGRADLDNAIALNASGFQLARVVGPALAGVLIFALGGSGPIFLLNAVSYAAVISGLFFMRKSELTPAELVPRAKGQLREGLRYVRERPELLMPILLVGFISMFSQSFAMLFVLMATAFFHAWAS